MVHFQPAAFVIENVPGLRDLDGGEQLNVAIGILSAAGYNLEESEVWDAADYGVPQFRQRMFVVGIRTQGCFEMPKKRDHISAGSVLEELPGPDVLNHETRRHKVASVSCYMVLNYGKRDQLGRVDRLTLLKDGNRGWNKRWWPLALAPRDTPHSERSRVCEVANFSSRLQVGWANSSTIHASRECSAALVSSDTSNSDC